MASDNHKSKRDLSQAGFTLIEMAIVVIIVGVIISIVAGVLPSLIATSKVKQARAMLERADNTLQGYSIANLRLPFADTDGDGLENNGAFTGTLPYRTIGLSSGQDVWSNLFQYAVYGTSGGANNLTQTFADANAFCTAISNASTTAFDATIAHTTTADPCGGATSTNASNQAYVLASGGLKDLDGANGRFDNCNGQSGAGFNIPGKIQDTTYDDLVRAYSLNELNQKNCSGSGGGGGGTGSAVESTAAGTCADGTDNDSDGDTDCDDSGCSTDPSCAGPSSVSITTTSVPSGLLNSTYLTTFAATGGSTPYSWSLTNDGGFTDFSINPSTGTLSGTLDQCPSPPDYTITVQVQDSTLPGDGGPFTDSGSFSVQVTGNLSINRTSGSGSTISWSSSSQTETFSTSGERIGIISWSLNTGGAAGFAVSSIGDTSCRIHKTGTTTLGTYTFILTATDANCATNTADLTLTVTVSGSGGGAPGNITGVVDTLEFYPSDMDTPNIIATSGNYYAIAFSDYSYDGQIRTVSIDGSGNIASGTNTYFDNSYGYNPKIIPINGDIFAVAYEGPGNDGWIKTFNSNSSGATSLTGNVLEFETAQGEQPDIVHVTGNIYAVVYRGRSGSSNDGWIDTVSITSSGALSGPINRYEFDSSQGEYPSIVQVSGDLLAVAYTGPGSDGWVKTLTIDASGNITDTGQSLEFDSSYGVAPVMVQVSNTIYAIAYTGPNNDGWIKTVSINASGVVTGPIASFEFDAVTCYDPDLIQLNGDVFVVAYQGSGSRGLIETVTIDSAGQISTTGSSLAFDSTRTAWPNLTRITNTMVAVAYSGPGWDGFVKTIGIE